MNARPNPVRSRHEDITVNDAALFFSPYMDSASAPIVQDVRPKTQTADTAAAISLDSQQTPAEQFRIVYDLILQGHSLANIRAEGTAKSIDVDDIIADSFRVLANLATLPTNVHYGWAIEAYRELYLKSIQIGDLANARGCVKEVVATAKLIAGRNPVLPPPSETVDEPVKP